MPRTLAPLVGGGGVEVAVDRGAANSQGRSDLGNRVLPGRIQLPRDLELVSLQDGGSAAVATAGPGGSQPSTGAFADQVAFELGQGGKDVEDQLAARRGGV